MNSPRLHQDSPWNTDLMLPRVTDNAKLLELQILLGGLSLVLSRVHPSFADSRFLATRRLAMRLTRGLECGDMARAHVNSDELKASLVECERSLDPGTLMVLKKLLVKTQREEAEYAHFDRQIDFTYSDFIAEEKITGMFANLDRTPGTAQGSALN